MPTIISHAVVPLALAWSIGRGRLPALVVGCGVVAAMAPDLDVAAFRLGIPYEHELGHRGASHALLTAAVLAALATAGLRVFRMPPGITFAFLFVAAASHGLLDIVTNGGRGVALLWPVSDERFFAPFRPVEVSPIGLSRFLSARGMDVLISELIWVWLPALVLALLLRRFFRSAATQDRSDPPA